MRVFLLLLFITLSMIAKSQIFDSSLVNINKILLYSSNKKQIPKTIQKYLKEKNGGKLKIASANSKIRSSDVLGNPFLKRRKLLFVASFDGLYLLSYEHGGYSHHYHMLLFRLDQENVITAFYNLLAPKIRNLNGLFDFIYTENHLLADKDHL